MVPRAERIDKLKGVEASTKVATKEIKPVDKTDLVALFVDVVQDVVVLAALDPERKSTYPWWQAAWHWAWRRLADPAPPTSCFLPSPLQCLRYSYPTPGKTRIRCG